MVLRWLARLAIVGLVGYAVALVVLVLWQRKLMYFPAPGRGPAAVWDMPRTETLKLRTSDGQDIVAWFQAPQGDRPLFLYFHGNGGTLSERASLFRKMMADGSGLLAIDYRGYGGSTGSPSEKGLLIDGETAYAHLESVGVPASRIVVVGESLGSAVAIAVAAKHPERALVLDSAFSSAVGIAQSEYPMFPVHALMMDPFESWRRIGGVDAPKLFLQGERDTVVPVASSRDLYEHARKPKDYLLFPDLGHVVLLAPGVFEKVKAWLDCLPKDST